MADAICEVGQKVRVTVGPGRTCRGLILCAGSSEQGDPTYDVLLQSPETAKTATAAAAEEVDSDGDRGGAGGDRELTGLPPSALSPMQPFEVDGSVDSPVPLGLPADEVSALAEARKGMGNTLFKLGDTDAAAEVFTTVLRALEPPPETGSTVLVRVLTGDAAATVSRYRSGMVSDAEDDGRSYDVIYDETDPNANGDGVGMGGADEEEDEEDGVAATRVVTVSLSPCVSCAARLNLARCSFRKGEHAEVVEACTLVMSLAKFAMADKQRPREERVKLRAHCLTALRMRGGSHLAQNHVGQARRDARSMTRSSGDDESRAQAARFEGDVERKAKALLKANRKLAKDVTRWVDASMAKHEEASVKGGDGDDPPVHVSPPPGSGRQIEGGSEGMGGGGVEECKGSEQSDSASGGGLSWLGLGSLLR